MNFPNVGCREGHLRAVLPSRQSVPAHHVVDLLMDLPLGSVQLVGAVKEAPNNDVGS